MSSNNKLWREVPGYVFVALARRGMEKISLDQCFLPNCDNKDINKLEPLEMKESDTEEKHIKHIKIKCHECNGIFQFKLETLKKVAKPSSKGSKNEQKEGEEKALSMGIAYALDEEGNNLGHIGYF